jgi:hypothetical protein
MADNTDFTKKILIDVELKSEQIKRDLPALIGEIDRLNTAQAAAKKAGDITSQAYIENGASLRALKAELRDANKYIDNTTKAVNAETGTLNQQRAVLSLITNDYTKLGDKSGVTADQIKKFTLNLKDQEKGIEQTYRNVGNYTDSILAANQANRTVVSGFGGFSAAIGQVKSGIGFLPGQIGAITDQLGTLPKIGVTAYNALGASVGQFNVVVKDHIALQEEAVVAQATLAEANGVLAAATEADTAAQIGFQLGTVTATEAQEAALVVTEAQAVAMAAQEAATIATTAATGAMTLAMNILKVAIASTGIGLLVIAIAGLVTYFTSTNEGAKKFKVILAEVNAVAQVALKLFGSIGKLIYDVFTGNFKELSGDIDKTKESFKSFGSNVKESVGAAKDLTVAQQQLTKAEREWSVEKTKQQGILDVLKLKIRDTGTAEAARIKAAKDAKAISDNIYKTDLEHAQKNLELTKKEQDLSSKKDYQAIADAQNRVQGVTNAHNQEIQSIQNRESRVEQMGVKRGVTEAKQADKLKENQAKALLDAEQMKQDSASRELQAIYDDYGDRVVAADNQYNKELTKLKKFLSDKYITQAEYNTVEAQLAKEHQGAIGKIIADFNKDDLEKWRQANNQLLNLKIASIQNDGEREIAAITQRGDEQLQELKKQDDAILETIAQLNNEVANLQGAAQAEAQTRLDNQNALLGINNEKRKAITLQGEKEIVNIKRKAARDQQAIEDEINVSKAKKGTNLFNNGGAQAAEIAAITHKYDFEISEAARAGQSTILLEKQKLDAIKELNNQYRNEKIEFAVQGEQMVQSAALDILTQGEQARSQKALNELAARKESELANANLTATQKKSVEAKFKKLEDAEKLRSFKANQKLQAANVLINGAVGVSKTIAEMGFIPALPVVGLLVASTALSIAKILSAKPGFASGGQFTSDGKGALLPGYSRKDNINSSLRSGEAVVVSEAMRNPWARNMVSDINVAFGGRSFATPGHQTAFATGGLFTDGGNANRYYSQPVYDQEGLANSMAYQLINNFPNVIVDVKDINNQQAIKAQTDNRVVL